MATVFSGKDGNANLSNGSFRTNRWNARIGPDQLDATGFGSQLKQRVAGMGDLSGSLVGYMTSATPPFFVVNGTVGSSALSYTAVVSLIAGPGCGITATVLLSNFQLVSNQLNTTTASGFTCDFANAGSTYQMAWTADSGN